MAKSAREAILEAAELIVVEQGASCMTMDAVAARAGVSKGGLIYHFPSQEKMMEALIERFKERLNQRREEVWARLPENRARNIMAYILSRADSTSETCPLGGGLLAAVMRAPRLLEPAKAAGRETLNQVLEGVEARDRDRMTVLVLAADCLWLLKLLGMQVFSVEEQDRIRSEIVSLAYEWLGVEAPSNGDILDALHVKN